MIGQKRPAKISKPPHIVNNGLLTQYFISQITHQENIPNSPSPHELGLTLQNNTFIRLWPSSVMFFQSIILTWYTIYSRLRLIESHRSEDILPRLNGNPINRKYFVLASMCESYSMSQNATCRKTRHVAKRDMSQNTTCRKTRHVAKRDMSQNTTCRKTRHVAKHDMSQNTTCRKTRHVAKHDMSQNATCRKTRHVAKHDMSQNATCRKARHVAKRDMSQNTTPQLMVESHNLCLIS